MELPTVQANEHASTNSSASNSVFSNPSGGDALTDLLAVLAANSMGSFVKGFYPAASFSSRLVHSDIFDEAGNDELAGFIQFLIAYSRHLLR